MKRLPELHPEARGELIEAADRYEHEAALGDDFLDEYERVREEIAKTPSRYREARDAGRLPPGIVAREAGFRRFPFRLVFVELEDGRVVTLAVAHKRRRPGYWRRRLA